MSWSPCPSPAIADVIRWKEPIWAAPTKKRGKPDSIGEQLVTAEVTAKSEFLELHVLQVEAVSFNDNTTGQLRLKAGDMIRRKKTTLESGDCERREK